MVRGFMQGSFMQTCQTFLSLKAPIQRWRGKTWCTGGYWFTLVPFFIASQNYSCSLPLICPYWYICEYRTVNTSFRSWKSWSGLQCFHLYSFAHLTSFQGDGPGLVYRHASATWDEPSPEEKERAMGFQTGTTSHTKVTKLERNALLGRGMDLNSLT
jgi:hypothetical protein